MKKKLPVIGIILVFIAGLGILSYPLISSVVNNMASRREAEIVEQKIEKLPDAEIEKLFSEAEEYNNSLVNTVILTDPFDEDEYEKVGARYFETFNVNDEGLVCYIEIPKINVFLPVYHGTDAEVLSKGAGHLTNTSFPIGGLNTHSVISAHSAFPLRTLFDYLPDLAEGDVFYIHVLDRILKYQVDQIKTVLPGDTRDLTVVNDRDFVTLMTCTPYTVNTHRLLVRGQRVENDIIESPVSAVSAEDEGMYFFGYRLSYAVVAAIIIGFTAAVIIAVVMILRGLGKKRRGKDQKDGGTDG